MSKCNLAYGLTGPGSELFHILGQRALLCREFWDALSIDVMSEADTEVPWGPHTTVIHNASFHRARTTKLLLLGVYN